MTTTSLILENLFHQDESPCDGEGVLRLSPYHWCYLHFNQTLILKPITSPTPLKEEYAPQGFVYQVWGPDTPTEAIWQTLKERYLSAASSKNRVNLEKWSYLAQS